MDSMIAVSIDRSLRMDKGYLLMFGAWFERLSLGRSHTIILTTISRRIYVIFRDLFSENYKWTASLKISLVRKLIRYTYMEGFS
jgi:hypothetical protein